MLSIPGLEIYPNRRKIYRGRKEISLMVKEYDLFYLLVVNQGHILTYNQIYQKVWGGDGTYVYQYKNIFVSNTYRSP